MLATPSGNNEVKKPILLSAFLSEFLFSSKYLIELNPKLIHSMGTCFLYFQTLRILHFYLYILTI
ncbi:hypothetical protein A464_4209 [Salmonella bongori N268-08]|uniref:Uncharacterized protein n=1 Tax=Salmonella bongori N268-08 TaxID=1197719 RepID=S5NM99_SALBN|nr:hypothetical protein A464_4209 [Salmonella bongori N268-08]